MALNFTDLEDLGLPTAFPVQEILYFCRQKTILVMQILLAWNKKIQISFG
jgi:hypothetical protein